MAQKSEAVKRWMRDKENEFPDPENSFVIDELQQTTAVPDTYKTVPYTQAWELSCRFRDTELGYDVTKTVYVLEDRHGTFHSYSEGYGTHSSAIYYGEYGL